MFLLLYPLSQALRYVTGANGEEDTADDSCVVSSPDRTAEGCNKLSSDNIVHQDSIDDSDSVIDTPARIISNRNHLFCIDSEDNSECNTPEHRCSADTPEHRCSTLHQQHVHQVQVSIRICHSFLLS